MSAREQILGRVRAAVGAGRSAAETDRLAARLDEHPRHLVPERGQLDPSARRALFVDMAVEAAATVARVADGAEVPDALTTYLSEQNLPARVVMAPDPKLDAIPWDQAPLLEIRRDKAEGDDAVGVAAAFTAIAETGTLLLVSGAASPTTINFLPETHVVILDADEIVGPYEDAWDRVRAAFGDAPPRTLNLITGPSRSADIEQTLQMGAHGPRRLHIILIDGAAED
ncbi:MAG: lactate utilization protein C [Alphaproteobacteria bacterium]|nr:lactate utilization protein C [Alphaproteobacteria bacterium]